MEYRVRFAGQMIPARPGIRMLVLWTSDISTPVVEAWGVFEEVEIDDDGTETPTGHREVRPLIAGDTGLVELKELGAKLVVGPYTPEEDITEDDRARILGRRDEQ